MNAFLLEEQLLSLDTVQDCRVIRRRTVGGSAQGPESERLVGYVVPATTIRPERLDEWIAALRQQCFDRSAADFGMPCDLVAVSRLPFTVEDQIDDDLLASQSVLDEQLAQRWEDGLKNLPGIKDAWVTVELDHQPLPQIHYSELFSEPLESDNGQCSPPAISQSEKQKEPSSKNASERGLSIRHGEPIKGVDELPRLLGEALQRAAQRYPDHGLRMILNGAELFFSYPELLDRACRILGGLQRAGLRPGDRVIFQFIENQDLLIAFWACILGGIVPVPLAPSRPGISAAANKLGHTWKILDASMVITIRELLPHIKELLSSLSLPDARVECVENLHQSGAGKCHIGDAEDLALIMLTSGSTGIPKAVMLSHRNLIRRSAGSAQMNGFCSDDVTLNWMPLDHVAGIVYFHLRDVFLGCQQIHAATDLVTRDPLVWLEWINRYRVTVTFAPNFAFALVNDRYEEVAARAHPPSGAWDLSCLRYLLNGAEAIVPRTARRFLQIFAAFGLSPAAMWPVWGMSETSSGTLYSDTFRLESSRDEDQFVEVGRPIPGFSIRIADENDLPILEGETGSLQVKGDQVMQGYYNRPDLTAESFTADGWFKTGDLGFLSRGRLTVTGREKDVIVINSVNYACHEIEALVEEIDGVETSFTAACAIRNPGANTDQLAIFFHPEAGCKTITPELLRAVRSTVSRRFGLSPEYILPVERDAIPKTNIGKIQRTQLAKSFNEGKFQDVVKHVEILTGGANTIPDWFFRPVWQRADVRSRRETGPTLVFADSSGLGECLRVKLAAAGSECVLVFQGAQFAEEADRFTIDPRKNEDYARLVATLTRRGFEPRSIAHLWTYCGDLAHPDEPAQIMRSQETGALSVLRLAQALEQASRTRLVDSRAALRMVVVSNGLQCIDDEACQPAFEKAPLLGLLKTIPQENPALDCCHLDIPLGDNENNAALVFREMCSRSHEVEVAYRGGRCWVRRLRAGALTSESTHPLPFEKGGLYLLSGGLGGIGIELARYLLKHFQANLILVGRRELGRDRSDALAALEALAAATGGNALYAAVDVGDRASLDEIVSRNEKLFSRKLTGIFHLAGLYHERPIAEETVEGFAEVLHPKAGALSLHQLLLNRPGALFVSFSSVNGFMGGYGVGAYAAANTFLESFSEYQRASAGLNAYCISWSLWDDIGMSRGYVMKSIAWGRGYYGISASQGLASLLAILQRAPGNTLVGLDADNLHVRRLTDMPLLPAQSLVAYVSGDFNAIARLTAQPSEIQLNIPDRYGTPTICHLKIASQEMIDAAGRIKKGRAASTMVAETTAMPEGPAQEMERTIAGIWREVLKLGQLSVTDNFFDLGGSSLAMGQANGRLQKILGRQISMTEMFQYTTVRTLAAYLLNAGKEGNALELSNGQRRGERRREAIRTRRR